MSSNTHGRITLLLFLSTLLPVITHAQDKSRFFTDPGGAGLGGLLLVLLFFLAIVVGTVHLVLKTSALKRLIRKDKAESSEENVEKFVAKLDNKEIDKYLKITRMREQKGDNKTGTVLPSLLLMLFGSILSYPVFAQAAPSRTSLFSQGGIIITLVLILTPILAGVILMIIRVRKVARKIKIKREIRESEKIARYLKTLSPEKVEEVLKKRKDALNYSLPENELSGNLEPEDEKGIIRNIDEKANIRFIEEKRKAIQRPQIDPGLSKLVIWYLVSATIWLLWGTSVGEYAGIKFVAPDADHVSWLSFGRLRPVHTNAVFWGWSSLAMLGLAYYVIPRVSNVKLYSMKWGWWSLWLINTAVFLGSISLMAGINNAGGEYREYIWPIQSLFAIAVVLTLVNFIKTIARRATHEIYVSNWYIIAALIFVLIITLVAYLPFWQDGLGETISQGYYMHQGVGMWFMMLTLGLVYYYLPQQLNKPIYSYSLGILAFWTQILFYTLIGSHHFIFSPIPWAIQTVAIVASLGMAIPVIAGTTNFLMTFKGSWHNLSGSYTLPFMLVGTIFYFTGSMQGSAEAFRTTNLYWHFTDFTTAHSHLTMYGIIAFFLWGFIYAIVPRLTRKEPPQVSVGIHFWLAFLGLMIYTIPLMIGGTMRGIMWMDGKPFIDSVTAMAPYWLWRAIGGTLMWISHLVFAYNMYKMIRPARVVNINEEPLGMEDDGELKLVEI
ncbi:MAG: cbb3-type cytochrome c oxidase subunit I [Chitinophagaceae bacterium]|nr:cbb3-type cytochrome c oxidase subunit I [Chitinophagaceae bacterium]